MSFNIDGLNYCALAHEIVDSTNCTSCGATAGNRCRALKRGQPTWDPYSWRWLAPSKSHRTRIEAYWREQRRTTGTPFD